MMGEGCESTPLAIVSGLELEFCEESSHDALTIPLEEDLYGPILNRYSKTEER